MIVGLQNWKCAGRRLVEIGGRLPTANALSTWVSFAFQQKSSLTPMMNPSPAEADLFTFTRVTLVQYSSLAGHFARNHSCQRKGQEKIPENKPGGQGDKGNGARKDSRRRGTSNASHSSEETARKATTATMNTR